MIRKIILYWTNKWKGSMKYLLPDIAVTMLPCPDFNHNSFGKIHAGKKSRNIQQCWLLCSLILPISNFSSSSQIQELNWNWLIVVWNQGIGTPMRWLWGRSCGSCQSGIHICCKLKSLYNLSMAFLIFWSANRHRGRKLKFINIQFICIDLFSQNYLSQNNHLFWK